VGVGYCHRQETRIRWEGSGAKREVELRGNGPRGRGACCNQTKRGGARRDRLAFRDGRSGVSVVLERTVELLWTGKGLKLENCSKDAEDCRGGTEGNEAKFGAGRGAPKPRPFEAIEGRVERPGRTGGGGK